MNERPQPRSAIAAVVLFALVGIVAVTPVRSDTSAAAPQATQTQAAGAGVDAPHELSVTVGKSLIINSPVPIDRISVGYGDFADANPVSPQEVLVNGKAPGETSLIIWQQGGGKLFFDLSVKASTTAKDDRVDTIRRQLKKEFADQDINLAFENDIVFLRGRVKNLMFLDRAVNIASTLGKVVNLLYVDVPPPDEQVILKVQFASIDRSVTTDLGLNLISTGAANTIGSLSTGQFPSGNVTLPLGQSRPFLNIADALNIFMLRQDINLGAFIRDLQVKGLVEVLAEPNVLAINGKQARFVAGGEFPYPVPQGIGGLGAVTIAFHEFGVRIDFLPLVTPRGTIKLQVAPEVSALDFANGLVSQGFNIPGLSTRKVQTEIELEPGQSFAIGGLLDRRLTETLQKMPLLADIPLLGALFRSKHLQKNNTELLVIVTPERVRPIPAGQKPPSLNMPIPMWGPDQMPRTPGMEITGNPPPKELPGMPFETLQQSIKEAETTKMQVPNQGIGYNGMQTPMSNANTGMAPSPAPAPVAPPK